MRQEIIKQFFSSSDREEQKPIKPWVIWLIVGSILFLAISSFGGEKKETVKTDWTTEQETDADGYLEHLEQRLQTTLEKITGAGSVSVFLYLEDNGEQVLATNRIQKSEETEGQSGKSDSLEDENEIVRWDRNGMETPYSVKHRYPKPTGILVVAEGAEDDGVKQEIYEAVRAIFGLSAHRIKITN